MPTLEEKLAGAAEPAPAPSPTTSIYEKLGGQPPSPPPAEEPGFVETGLRSIARGGLGVYSGLGAAAEAIGEITDTPGVENFGRGLRTLANEEIQTGLGRLEGPSFEGTFVQNPSLKRAVELVGEAVPSLGLAVATGGTASAVLRGAGFGLRAAEIGGAATAAGALGAVEGAPQYVEAREAGRTIPEASLIGGAATVGTALLEYLPISKILGSRGAGAITGALTGIVTEGTQEATQQVWQNLVAKIGYDRSRSLAEGVVESFIGGAGAGGIVGGITGRLEGQQRVKDTAIQTALQNLAPDTTVNVTNGVATLSTAGGEVNLPAAPLAQALSAGASMDEIAEAAAELQRQTSSLPPDRFTEAASALRQQQLQRSVEQLPDDELQAARAGLSTVSETDVSEEIAAVDAELARRQEDRTRRADRAQQITAKEQAGEQLTAEETAFRQRFPEAFEGGLADAITQEGAGGREYRGAVGGVQEEGQDRQRQAQEQGARGEDRGGDRLRAQAQERLTTAYETLPETPTGGTRDAFTVESPQFANTIFVEDISKGGTKTDLYVVNEDGSTRKAPADVVEQVDQFPRTSVETVEAPDVQVTTQSLRTRADEILATNQTADLPALQVDLATHKQEVANAALDATDPAEQDRLELERARVEELEAEIGIAADTAQGRDPATWQRQLTRAQDKIEVLSEPEFAREFEGLERQRELVPEVFATNPPTREELTTQRVEVDALPEGTPERRSAEADWGIKAHLNILAKTQPEVIADRQQKFERANKQAPEDVADAIAAFNKKSPGFSISYEEIFPGSAQIGDLYQFTIQQGILSGLTFYAAKNNFSTESYEREIRDRIAKYSSEIQKAVEAKQTARFTESRPAKQTTEVPGGEDALRNLRATEEVRTGLRGAARTGGQGVVGEARTAGVQGRVQPDTQGRTSREAAAAGERPAARPADLRDPIAALNAGIARYLGRDIDPNTYTLAEAPAELAEAFTQLDRLLGKQTVFFNQAANAPIKFGGVTNITPNVVYLRADAPGMVLRRFGHEIGHEIERDSPELYAALKAAVLPAIPASATRRVTAALEAARAAEGRPALSQDAIESELVNDFLGEYLSTQQSWVKIERAFNNPGLFERLVTRFFEIFEQFKSAFTGNKYLTKAESAAAKAFVRYAEQKQRGVSKEEAEFSRDLVFYHGTTASFDQFATPSWFTTDPGTASIYATQAEGANVVPVTIELKNPFVMENFEDITQVTPGMVDALQRAGFDGLSHTAPDGQTTVVPFDSEQIKSLYDPQFARDFGESNVKQTAAHVTAAAKKGVQYVESLAKAAASGQQAVVSTAKTWLKVTPLPFVNQWFADREAFTYTSPTGKKSSLLSRYDRIFGELTALRNSIVNLAGEHHNDVIEKAKAGAGIEALYNAMYLGTFYQMTPWESMYSQAWVPQGKAAGLAIKGAQENWVAAGMQEATGKTFQTAYREAKEAYEKLNPGKAYSADPNEVQHGYQQWVDDVRNIHIRQKNAMQRIIEQTTEPGSETQQTLLTQLDEAFAGLKGAYLPLYRYGDFILRYTDVNELPVTRFFDSGIKQQAEMQILTAEYPEHDFKFKPSGKTDRPRVLSSIPSVFIDQLGAAVMDKYTEGVTDDKLLEDRQRSADTLIQDMKEVWLRWQPETAALKNNLRRKTVQGASLDMGRGFLKYMQTHGSEVAYLEKGRKLEDTIEAMDAQAKELNDRGVDTTLDNFIIEDLRDRYAASRTTSTNKLTAAITRIPTLMYMTSPSIALVQMSQLGVLTLPNLASKHGWGKAAGALRTGVIKAFSKQYSQKVLDEDIVVTSVFEDIQADVTPEDRTPGSPWENEDLGAPKYTRAQLLEKISRLDDYQQHILALRMAATRNLLDISLAHEVNEVVQGEDPNAPAAKAMRLAMTFMRESELASRKATILATYDLAKADGKDFFQSINEIADVVDKTLFNYANEAKGVWLQGNIARPILQFQTFRIMAALKMATLAKQTFQGDVAARKEFVGIMGMAALLSGTAGLPLAGALFKIIDMVMGDDDEPFDSRLKFTNWLEENFGETVAGIVEHGIGSALGGNLSRRIGLGDITGGGNDIPEYLHGDGLAAYLTAQAAGPFYSVASGWFKGYDLIYNKGEVMRGLEAVTPKPMRDILRAYRYGTEGVKTLGGVKLIDDAEIGADDLLMLGLGFQPENISRAQERRRRLGDISTQISARRGRLVNDLVRKLESGEDYADQVRAIEEFRAKMPAFAITGSEIRSAYGARAKGEAMVPGRREALVEQKFGR